MPALLKLESTARLLLLLAAMAPAAGAMAEEMPSTGTTGFCLFELPATGDRRHWINLAHVQSIELQTTELRITYGGGNLGSGHEARLPIRSKDDAATLLKRLVDTARACR